MKPTAQRRAIDYEVDDVEVEGGRPGDRQMTVADTAVGADGADQAAGGVALGRLVGEDPERDDVLPHGLAH
jgi:hypothetical protein